ncbi:MAG: SUMF1/EgtB/PvdO family nonheme iron enzyme, partial [Isosphaeraceae bacterium]
SPTGDCPANNVSWVDQILFCNWLSRREGRQPCYEHTGPGPAAWRCDFDADGYRLPTAAEWEYACRAGTTTRYPFGDQPDLLTSYGEVERLQTLPCGSRLPNAWGLFDMIGNVWESCWDGTEEQGLTFRLDPIGHAPNSLYDMRGGGRGAGGIHTLSGYRILKSAGFRDSDNGFRVVCGIPGAKADPRRRVDDLATSSLRRHEGPQAEAALHIVLGFWYHQSSEPAEADAQFARADELAASLTPGSGDGPALAAIWRGLATWYESHSCWLEAAARYAKAVVANPEDPNLHRYLAIARLLSGDMSGYRSACAAMLDRFGGTTDPAIALPVTVACVYAPGAVADMADLVRLATTAVTSDSDSERYLGYAHFRAGRFQEALNRVEKVHGNSLLDLWNQLYAGMAHQRLGNAYEARRLLLQARRWMDKADRAPPGSAGKNQPGWTTVMDRDYADHLYRELETLLNGPAPDLPANVFAP